MNNGGRVWHKLPWRCEGILRVNYLRSYISYWGWVQVGSTWFHAIRGFQQCFGQPGNLSTLKEQVRIHPEIENTRSQLRSALESPQASWLHCLKETGTSSGCWFLDPFPFQKLQCESIWIIILYHQTWLKFDSNMILFDSKLIIKFWFQPKVTCLKPPNSLIFPTGSVEVSLAGQLEQNFCDVSYSFRAIPMSSCDLNVK